MAYGRKSRWITAYVVVSSVLLAMVSTAFAVLFHHGGYDTKLWVALGLQEPMSEIDWAVRGWNNMLSKMNYDADIVFLGDSLTAGSDF